MSIGRDKNEVCNIANFPSSTFAEFGVIFTVSGAVCYASSGLWPLSSYSEMEGGKPLLFSYAIIAWMLLSLVFYIAHPFFQRRKFGEKLESIEGISKSSGDSLSKIITSASEEIEQISLAAKVKAPKVFCDRDITNTSAIVYGLKNRKHMAIGLGIVFLYATNKDRFRAIVAHEIGHIQARDVWLAFFARAMIFSSISIYLASLAWWLSIYFGAFFSYLVKWTAKYGIMDAPRIAVFYWKNAPHAEGLLEQVIHKASLGALTFFICAASYKSLLRKREVYADIFSARINSESSILKCMYGQSSGGFLDKILVIFRAHPLAKQRSSVIMQPERAAPPSLPSIMLMCIAIAWTQELSMSGLSDDFDMNVSDMFTGNGFESIMTLEYLVAFIFMAMVMIVAMRMAFSIAVFVTMGCDSIIKKARFLVLVSAVTMISLGVGEYLAPSRFGLYLFSSSVGEWINNPPAPNWPMTFIFLSFIIFLSAIFSIVIRVDYDSGPSGFRWVLIILFSLILLNFLINVAFVYISFFLGFVDIEALDDSGASAEQTFSTMIGSSLLLLLASLLWKFPFRFARVSLKKARWTRVEVKP